MSGTTQVYDVMNLEDIILLVPHYIFLIDNRLDSSTHCSLFQRKAVRSTREIVLCEHRKRVGRLLKSGVTGNSVSPDFCIPAYNNLAFLAPHIKLPSVLCIPTSKFLRKSCIPSGNYDSPSVLNSVLIPGVC